jgi:hypothetical protein
MKDESFPTVEELKKKQVEWDKAEGNEREVIHEQIDDIVPEWQCDGDLEFNHDMLSTRVIATLDDLYTEKLRAL